MNEFLQKYGRTIVVVIVAIAASVGITIVFTDEDNDGKNDHVTIKFPLKSASPAIPDSTRVDTADPDAKPDTPLELTPTAQKVAQDFVNDPKDLSNAGPVPLSGSGVQKNIGEVPFPMAADSIDGCRTRFLKTNFSTRSVPLSRVIVFELHYTAGADIPNSRADVDGLTAFGNRPSSRVSWHFNMDKDGNCDYNVPLRMKAWTIADLNSYTINVEVAGRGEAPYLRPGGYRKLASIIAQVHRAYPGITLRMAATSNCVPTRGGIGTHWQGGACSGGHDDIHPHDIAAVIRQLRRYSRKPITKAQRRRCRELHRLRHDDKTSPAQTQRIRAITEGERRNGLVCKGGRLRRR